MRYGAAIAMLLLWACDGGGSTPHPDASSSIDARSIDAPIPVDAAVDAPPADPAIAAACMDLCNAISACFAPGDPVEPSCYTECGQDLADCTAQQVQQADACKSAACGDETNSPIIDCLGAVACIQM